MVHGGAIPLGTQGEGSFHERLHEAIEEKLQIAVLAASLFVGGDTLVVDTGTTTLAFANELALLLTLSVLTNLVRIAETMARSEQGHNVILLGGNYKSDASETVGHLAAVSIARYSISDVVLTPSAVDTRGAMDHDPLEAELARTMIASGGRVTILAHHSKLGKSALNRICGLDEIDRPVTTQAPERGLREALNLAGVEVLVAGRTVESRRAMQGDSTK
jgi:DeoR/GlpR family transcriptional regulator of sugar metabolism